MSNAREVGHTVPSFVVKACDALEESGALAVEGIFRKSGQYQRIEQLRDQLDQGLLGV